MSIKICTRNLIAGKKNDFSKTNDHIYMIEAAVLKGVYRGVGGSKIIVLPTYCHVIVESLRYIIKAKGRFTGETIKDINRLSYEVTKNIKDVSSLELDRTSGASKICLCIRGEIEPFNIDVQLNNPNKHLVNIGITLIANLSKDHKFSAGELNIIHKIFENRLNYLARGYQLCY